ncbi:IS66 family transposase [Burkholderia ubonensis]|uniref:IS66 family transposase n=1 Tax=Burkholderia ubonensis TaxID=101571 RepID=UPI000AB72B91
MDDGQARDAVEEIRAGQAIRYSLNQWEALMLYCEEGRAEISNALAENALRCAA